MLTYRVLRFLDELTSVMVAVLLMLLAAYAGYALWDNGQVYAAAETVRRCRLRHNSRYTAYFVGSASRIML